MIWKSPLFSEKVSLLWDSEGLLYLDIFFQLSNESMKDAESKSGRVLMSWSRSFSTFVLIVVHR